MTIRISTTERTERSERAKFVSVISVCSVVISSHHVAAMISSADDRGWYE